MFLCLFSELLSVQFRVSTFERKQIVMCPLLGNFATGNDSYLICVSNG